MELTNGTIKKKLGFGFIAIIFLLILQACSTGSNNDVEGKNVTGETNGGTLKVARASDATGMDPHFVTNVSTANVLYQKVYETLVIPDDNMEIQPHLATDWNQINDHIWEFKLRENVNFHDGTPFNAEAVKATFDRLLDPETASPQADKLGMVDEIEIIDEFTVQFHLSKPYAPLLSILAANEGSIISPKLLEKGKEEMAIHAAGTGPVIFEKWDSGSEISFIRNDAYWGDLLNFEKLVFVIVPEDSTRIGMVETGEIHISEQIPVTDIERIENSNSMKLHRTEGLGTEFIGFNVQLEPFDNILVRQAVSHAIEREAIISGVYNDVGKIANLTMSPKVSGYTESIKPYDYNINKAKELLVEAGYPNGFKATLLTPDFKERINAAEVIQSQLKGVGIDLNVNILEYGAYIDATSNGEGHLYSGSWGNATGDGDYNQYNLFHSNSMGASGNLSFYSNPEVDKLIEDGRGEQDPQKREEIYKQSQTLEMDEAVYVPIRTVEHLVAYNTDKVEGFKINPVSYMLLQDIKVKE